MRRTLTVTIAVLGLGMTAAAANRVGDANNDHFQNMADAVLVQSRLYGAVAASAISPLALADGDNVLDLGDFLYVAQIAKGSRTSVVPRPALVQVTPPAPITFASQASPNPVLPFGIASSYPSATKMDGMDGLTWAILEGAAVQSNLTASSSSVASGSTSTQLVAFNPVPPDDTVTVRLQLLVMDSSGAPDHWNSAQAAFTVTSPVCGDSATQTDEGCDDGNTADCDGCRGDCSAAETGCGDGFVCGVEGCDDGNTINDCACRSNCALPGCGDGVICGAEFCDDGDATNCGSCGAGCTGPSPADYCGDGLVCPPELCDEGPNNGVCGSACNAACSGPLCGNGLVECGETCDSGASNGTCGFCNTACTGPYVPPCGNGLVECGEACDDGNATECGTCSATCTGSSPADYCGDGIVCGAEACDDGNLTDGDGCSANCLLDGGCAGGPVSLHPVAHAFDVVGTLAYVIGYGQNQLVVVDISNPAAPQVLNTQILDTLQSGGTGPTYTGTRIGMAVLADGPRLYVATLFAGTGFYAGLVIYDISTPSSPVQLGKLDFASISLGIPDRNVTDVAVGGNYAFVTYEAGLRILDISNPGSPVSIRTVNMGHNGQGVELAGNYAFVTVSDIGDTTSDLRIVDISNPATASVVSIIPVPGLARQFAISGGHAYVASYLSGLTVIDIGNPLVGQVVGAYNTAGIAHDVRVSGNRAYVADDSGGVAEVNVSNPAAPSLAGTMSVGGDALLMGLNAARLYVATGDTGLFALCRPPACGNGAVESGETCDDSNATECGLCNSSCTGSSPADTCGDGVVCGVETCDEAAQNGQPNHCNATCSGGTAPVCGNGVAESGEVCDDGPGGTCQDNCQGVLTCGNAALEGIESCDEGSYNGWPDRCALDCLGQCETTQQWTASIQSSSVAQYFANAMAADANGNVYFARLYNGTGSAGGLTVANSQRPLLLTKINSTGQVEWLKAFTVSSCFVESFSVVSLAVDNAGNVHLHARIMGTVNFGGGALAACSYGSSDDSGGHHAFAKFAPDGTHLWSFMLVSTHDKPVTFSLLPDGQSYIWGWTNFNTSRVDSSGTTTAIASSGAYVLKLNASGQIQWNVSYPAGPGGLGRVAYSAADPGGLTLLTETSSSLNLQLVRYDSNGSSLWSKSFGGYNGIQRGVTLLGDGTHRVWLAALANGNGDINLGEGLVSGAGVQPLIAHYGPTGALLAVRRSNYLPRQWRLGPQGWLVGTELVSNYTANLGNVSVTSLSDGRSSTELALLEIGLRKDTLAVSRARVSGHLGTRTCNGICLDFSSAWNSTGGEYFATHTSTLSTLTHYQLPDNAVCNECGNGLVEPGETCDAGSLNGQPGQCNPVCGGVVSASCGNWTVEAGEVCDDGPVGSCFDDCSGINVCGDGIVFGVEACDDGLLNVTPNHCNWTCTGIMPSGCGNGVVEAGELCDDANTAYCTGPCNPTCTALYPPNVCGDGILATCTESCEDGDTTDCTFGCNSTCTGPAAPNCGNGIVDCGEACDQGAMNGQPNQCNSTCSGTTASVCGNGALEAGEVCDDGNTGYCAGACNPTCTGLYAASVCGDGVVQCGEACDEGVSNDPCGTCGTDCLVPSPCPTSDPVVSAGRFHTCRVNPGGLMDCWGSISAPLPGTYATPAAGYSHSCAIRSDGGITCWGLNGSGQCNSPAGIFAQLDTDFEHGCGLRSDGAIVCWGHNGYGKAAPPAGSYKGVATGQHHSCGLRTDGTIACWGDNGFGQSSPPIFNFDQISAGYGLSCGRRTSLALMCWGDNTYGQATAPSGNFLSVSAGGYHACGIKSDGTLQCWGLNNYGQTTAPGGIYLSVSAGVYHTCAVRDDGATLCWGINSNGQSGPIP